MARDLILDDSLPPYTNHIDFPQDFHSPDHGSSPLPVTSNPEEQLNRIPSSSLSFPSRSLLNQSHVESNLPHRGISETGTETVTMTHPIPSSPSLPYYDHVVSLPSGSIYHFHQLPLNRRPSSIPLKRTVDSVFSSSPLMNHSTEELWNFILTSTSRPSLSVEVLGEPHGQSPGFSFVVDLTDYFNESWSSILSFQPQKQGSFQKPPPNQNEVTQPTIREVLEKFTRSKRSLKQLEVEQSLTGWDWSLFETR